MRRPATTLHQAPIDQLLASAHDALNIAGRHRGQRPGAGQYVDVDRSLGNLTQTAEALGRTIDELARTLTTQHDNGRVDAVDGPFVGEAEAANLWLAKGGDLLDEAALAIINAHIAASGLAANTRTDGQHR